MMSRSNLTLTTSPRSQTAKNPDRAPSLTLRQRLLYGRKRYYRTGKERDSETGLYYYGARYLDSKTSRWLSGDPAMGEYVPEAPVSDEARKRNGNLPGMGGVFNYVNLHVYHYAGNNPVKYVDPDGKKIKISGNLSYRNEVMKLLRKIDPNVRINWITGVVTTSGGNTPGSILISRLQTNRHTVTISDGNHVDAEPKSLECATTIGMGTNTTVSFSIRHKNTSTYYLKDKDGNIYSSSDIPKEIGLGHELIHGLHNAEGTREADYTVYTYQIEGILNGQPVSGNIVMSRKTGTKFPREEAKTIGVGEYKNNLITENSLRRQLGYDERLNH